MKTILFFGSTYGNNEAIRYAKSLGVRTIVTDYLAPEQSKDKLVADEYWMISTGDLDALEVKCRQENVNAIANFVSDFNIKNAAILSARLNLPFFTSEEVFRYSIDKRAFKDFCRQHGVPTPKDYFVDSNSANQDLSKVQYPVVVKPTDMAGNVGLSYCENQNELRQGIKLALDKSPSKNIIVEQQLTGDEWYSIYAMSQGEIRHIALNAMYSEPGYPSCCYSITTTVSSWIRRWVSEVNPLVENMLNDMNCQEGACFVQGMTDGEEIYVIEMGYRLDGDTMFIPYKQLINFDLIHYITDYLLQGKSDPKALPSSQTEPFEKCACSYMLWTHSSGTLKNIYGLEDIAKMKNTSILRKAYPGDHVDQFRPVGNIMFVSDTCKEMCQTIDYINKTIKVLDQADNDILIRYTDFGTLLKNDERQY